MSGHDLPNKAKIGVLETYEPGLTANHDMELYLIETGQSSQHADKFNTLYFSALYLFISARSEIDCVLLGGRWGEGQTGKPCCNLD
nr:putative 2-oxoglutarate (2OG) and Fe(II)-dependent oxygenase superfamily protein [Tanacetum cinerariifolium]